MAEKSSLKEVASLFFKLGFVAFGGPAAHISMMEEEVVEKRKWMDREHFLDLVGATNLIPGPNSTEMTMHIGHERAGALGLFIAGISFLVPATLLTGILAWLYVTYGQLPDIQPFIFGIKPAVLSVIAAAIWKLGQKALKGFELGLLGAMVLTAGLLGVNEVMALLGAGLLGAIYFDTKRRLTRTLHTLPPLMLLKFAPLSLGGIASSTVFLKFLKVGAVLYGSGYVLFAYLDAELVATGFLSRLELLDAIAVGQFTPGPVLSTATFIGFQLNGIYGALAATAGIFLPSFLFVWLLNPLIPKLRSSAFLSGFLDSVNIAAVAVMTSVLLEMGRDSLTDWRAILIATAGFVLTFGFKKANAMWIVAGGSLAGYLLLLV